MEPKPTITWKVFHNKQYLESSDNRRGSPYAFIVHKVHDGFCAYIDYDQDGADNIISPTTEEEAKKACIEEYFKEVYS